MADERAGTRNGVGDRIDRRGFLRTVVAATGAAGSIGTARTTSAGGSSPKTVTSRRRGAHHFRIFNLQPGNVTVEQGETFEWSAMIENVSEFEDTQEVEFVLDDEVVATTELPLDPEEFTTVSTEVTTADLNPGDHTYSVTTEADRQSAVLTVEAPATFELDALDPGDATVEQGDTVAVSVTVENTGDREGTQEVTLDVDGGAVASERVTLAGGDTATVSFEIDTAPLEGTVAYTVASVDDEVTGTLTVEIPASFVVDTIEPTEATVDGNEESFAVSAEIANTGDLSGTGTVVVRLDGRERRSRELTLGGGERRRLTFAVPLSGIDPGTYTYAVVSGDDERTGTLTVEAGQQADDGTDGTPSDDGTAGADDTTEESGDDAGTDADDTDGSGDDSSADGSGDDSSADGSGDDSSADSSSTDSSDDDDGLPTGTIVAVGGGSAVVVLGGYVLLRDTEDRSGEP